MVLTMSDIANIDTLKNYSRIEVVVIASRINDKFLQDYFIKIIAMIWNEEPETIKNEVNFAKAKLEDGEL